jgi:hypothetical protein
MTLSKDKINGLHPSEVDLSEVDGNNPGDGSEDDGPNAG